MEDIFRSLIKAEQLAKASQDLIGKAYGLHLAVVADTQDPLTLGRIRVFLPSKGDRSVTDWLPRLVLSPFLQQPLVSPGDTVVVGFIEGNPHSGVYLGVVNNMVNPTQADTSTTAIALGKSTVVVSESSVTMTVGNTTLAIADGVVSISGATSVMINGKQVATVGAKDNDGETLVTKGW